MGFFSGDGSFPPSDFRDCLPFKRSVLLYSDFAAAAASATVALDAPPSNAIPLFGAAKVEEAFTLDGSDATGFTVQVGDAADPDEIMTALNLIGVAADTVNQLGGVGARNFNGVLESAYAPIATGTATGGATPLTNELTAGQLIVRVYYCAIPVAAGF